MENTEPESDLYSFEIKDRDGLARIGRFKTRSGILPTPVLLPVINPNNLTVLPEQMERELGVSGYITNGYIIHSHADLKERALEKGIHDLLGTKLPVMTDSGTFQMYVYGEFGEKGKTATSPSVDPDEIIKFQAAIKSDIITILDLFTDPSVPYDEAERRAAETLIRARSAVPFKDESALACTVQGGMFPDLRKRAASDLNEVDCEVHPIGGVVPLMENYRYSEIVKVVLAAKSVLKPDRPVHLFGAGHPMIFPLAVYLGCDIFDSSSYAKYAQADRLMFPDGTRHLADIQDLPCGCVICSKYSASELKELPGPERKVQLALHNLHASFNELKAVRQAIMEGTLREMVEKRAAAHPYLFEALKELGQHTEFLERYEPLARKRFMYTGPGSSTRPELYRYKKRFFERYKLPETKNLIIFEDKTGQKPYSAQFASEIQAVSDSITAHFMAISFFGPVPIELDEMYPLAQSVIPTELGFEDRDRINKLMERFAHRHRHVFGIIWDGEETLDFLKGAGDGKPVSPGVEKEKEPGEVTTVLADIDVLRTAAVADLQFGSGAGEILTGYPDCTGELTFRKSPSTGRIRNVYRNGEHILSFRAGTGFLALKPAGAELLRKALPKLALRVVVEQDSVEFNREGKNVFAKFVIDCDDNIRVGDEVLVVSESDELAAIGRSAMTRFEMLSFKKGIAVKVKEGIPE